MKELNYEKDLSIDKYKLDEEWIRQPSLFMYYAEEACKADSDAREAREKIEHTKATLYVKIRTEKENEGTKVTEAMLENLIKTDPSFIVVNSDYIKKLEAAKMLNNAVEAFSQRKSALENLVKMNLAGYFSKPTDIKMSDGETQTGKATQTATNNQRNVLNKRRGQQ